MRAGSRDLVDVPAPRRTSVVTRGTAVVVVVVWIGVLVGALAFVDPTHAVLVGWLVTVLALPLYYLGTLIPSWLRSEPESGDETVEDDELPTFWARHTWCDPLLRRALGVGLAFGWLLVVIHLQVVASGIDDVAGLVLGLGSIPVYVLAVGIASGSFESKRARYARTGRPASFWKRHPWLDAILGD